MSEVEQAGRRLSQRQPLSCIECARRKSRCSKTIPCTGCIDRGIEQLCKREEVNLRKRNLAAPEASQASSNSTREYHNGRPRKRRCLTPPSMSRPHGKKREVIQTSVTPEFDPMNRQTASTLIDGVAQDAAVTLEFLALGRQRVMQLDPNSPARSETSMLDFTVSPADPIFAAAQVRRLLLYHEENIAWMHNVVHLPTHRQQCERFLATGQPINKFWLPLYYVILSVRYCAPITSFQNIVRLSTTLDDHLYDTSFSFIRTRHNRTR